MRIHSDKLTRADLAEAIMAAGLEGVYVDGVIEGRSQSRARGFTVKLAARPGPGRRRRNTGRYGAEDAGHEMYQASATYDEHGAWMAELFERDPDAIVTYYKGRDDFHDQTEGKYRKVSA
jgi:hypothetical protein